MEIAIPSFSQFMSEQDLIRQLLQEAKAGDLTSLERLVILHEKQILRLAQRLLLNREAAKDASQEVFLRLQRKLHLVDQNRNFRSWLYRATANVCFDYLRRAKHDLPLDLIADPCDTALDPEQTTAAIQQKQLIIAALKELSPRERQAIVLRDLEGCSTAEVAEILGSTVTTVRSQISTGRVKMKDFVISRLERRP